MSGPFWPAKDEWKDELKEQQEAAEAKAKLEKPDWKEGKPEWKELKDESKVESSKEHLGPEQPEPIREPPIGASVPVPSVPMLLAHAEALEDAARTLRHFIAQAERPDLRRGALRGEPDDPEGRER